MASVKVKCKETRYVADQRYIVGNSYTMDAERAGKYSSNFEAASNSDQEAIDKAWGTRKAEEAEKKAYRTELLDFDPSILHAAATLIRQEAAKRLTSAKVA